MCRLLILLCLSMVVLPLCASAESEGGEHRQIFLVSGDGEDDGVLRVAEVVKRRILRRSDVVVEIGERPGKRRGLLVYLGCVGMAGDFAERCDAHGMGLPGGDDPAPESYAVKTVMVDGVQSVLAIGADARGVLYAAGEVLRQMRYGSDWIRMGEVDVSAAPAYRYRCFSPNQGGTMRKVTGARGWEQAELFEALQDYALAGANGFYAEKRGGPLFDYIKSFGLLTINDARPNENRGEFPDEWRAGGLDRWEGTHWVCPSIPEARRALLALWEEEFRQRPSHDVMRMYSGDPGGCRDERCMPWGRTYVHLCEEVANLWLAGHPDSIVLVANQDLTNEGDQAIFDYLNERPRDWLYGLCYGPGSNALSEYFRDELREDLFVYPGSGPTTRYLAEILHSIPARQRIVHFSDITHWISAQYAVENPEPNVVKSFGRRTLHTRPRAFYQIFQAIMPFSEGDMIYSEGYHDEFHQYLWCRLLWEPNRSLEDVMREYCVVHFGEASAEPMMDAMLQLEENLETPLETNPGIDRYYLLVKEAGWRMPPNLMERNHRWRLHMQKAALDKYVQLKLRIELAKERRIADIIEAGLDSGELDQAIEQAAAVVTEPAESPEMAQLREEARRLGEESEALFGIRNVGYFKLDQPLRPLPAIERVLSGARESDVKKEKRERMADAMELTEQPTRVGNIFW